ncbi:hypothetical protein LSAT2_016208 [Lamellibrachia satsuma]|nr:hypothetical protein LSAT2_016208 [Lamellibrachia satsuma]
MHPTATAAMAEDKGKVATFGEFKYVESARPSEESGTVKTKHVFVAVTCIVVVAVLVAGLIGASYVFKSATKDIAKEDVEVDTTDDVVTYRMETSLGEQWVLNDFSKGVTLYKMNTNGNTACFVSPLNHSEADPKTVKANMKKMSIAQSNVDGSYSDIFSVTGGPIKKPAFLGKTINSMCSGASIYWLSPTCGGNSSDLVEKPGPEGDSSTRHKRALRCIMCGSYKCYDGDDFQVVVNGWRTVCSPKTGRPLP